MAELFDPVIVGVQHYTYHREPTRGDKFLISQSLLDCIKEKQPFLPTCMHYKELLELEVNSTGRPIDEVREERGEWTYADWAKFFRLK